VAGCRGRPAGDGSPGVNPDPVHLVRNPVAPLSPVAVIGKEIFFDVRMSRSGKQSCASCHTPARAYGPPDSASVQPGGPGLRDQGARAVPSLRYLDRVPNFSIGPDRPEAENVSVGSMTATSRTAAAVAATSVGASRPVKRAGSTATAAAMVPRGGLFWDGRVNTLQGQTLGPLFNHVEMANLDTSNVARRIRALYGTRLAAVLGTGRDVPDRRLLDEAMFAVARFEVEDSTFHPYDSKFDAYLAGEAVLSPAESRGLALFENPRKGNCAACHPSRPGPDGRPPTFTDYQYEALGVPRNSALAANRPSSHYDLGLCGPFRTDLASQTQYCGMFRTPSLRNAALRGVYFHNGVYHTLAQVLAFYDFRDVFADSVYPKGAGGAVRKFDDLPTAYWGNADTLDAPFDRRPGQPPALTPGERSDIVAFIGTLTDGYRR
jgi:cytochrome c peroxidase